MAIFRFRLASVLRYRERIREQRRWELFTLEQAKQRLASEITKLEHLLTWQTKEMEEQQGKMLSVADLRSYGDFSQRVAQKIKEQRRLLATVQKKLGEKQGEVVQADTGVKSLDQLRHRFWEKHRQQENREEQKLSDEIGQRKHFGRDK
jgi:flagellar FliJ protein